MNWTGPLLGASALVAVAGALGAALLPRPRWALAAMALALAGVCGVCFAVGAGFVALFVASALVAVPLLSLGAALAVAAPSEPDRRTGPRGAIALTIFVVVFLGLGLALARTTWPPAGGPWQASPEWFGSRLLIDQSLVLVLAAAVLSLAGMGAVALLRQRSRR